MSEADFTISDHGTIILLKPHTSKALAWVEENIGRENGYQPYWPTVLCEPRYAQDILDGIGQDGLEVSSVRRN